MNNTEKDKNTKNTKSTDSTEDTGKTNYNTLSALSPGLAKVLTEMASRVNADFNTVDITKSSWYNTYEWSVEECINFIDWLTEQLIKDEELREEILAVPTEDEQTCRRAASAFAQFYGWKFTDEATETTENAENADNLENLKKD